MSSKNPFRHPPQQEAIVAPPSPPLPPLPQRTPSPKLPALPPQSSTSGPSSQPVEMPTSSLSRRTQNIDDDLPPPYTPAANIGEETIGLGPRRPFQRAPLIPPSAFQPPLDQQRPHPNWPPPSAQPYPIGSSWGSGYYAQPAAAPWQSQQQYRQRHQGGGGLIGALIDTVREIADAVSGAPDERSQNVTAYAAPYPGARTTYAPPPGPPPQHPPPRPASAPPSSPPPILDDGSPTRTPVPGHPLLRDGNLLVYPKDYVCCKCEYRLLL